VIMMFKLIKVMMMAALIQFYTPDWGVGATIYEEYVQFCFTAGRSAVWLGLCLWLGRAVWQTVDDDRIPRPRDNVVAVVV
jgi:hypothetical protein